MPGRHFEIQLGHLCNDRCVFCISGRRTAEGRAPLLPEDTVLRSIRAGWGAGHRTLTLLGGEPTIQPVFLPAVRLAVALGFEKIVIFSNGSKTGRTDLMDEVLATGGRFEWRFSVHGATEEAHERTTGRRGSFGQLMRSIAAAHARGQDITTNTCVVVQNHASLDRLPALLAPYNIRHVHVDMIHPKDMGDIPRYRGDSVLREYLHTMVPRYTDIVDDLTRMVQGFPKGFPVSIGNLPYCVAPQLAPWIHHAGEGTHTVTVDDVAVAATLHAPHDKYRTKHLGAGKLPACHACVFDPDCCGFFDDYRLLYGLSELRPVTPAVLHSADPDWRLFAHHARTLLSAATADWTPPSPFAPPVVEHLDDRTVTLSFARSMAPPVRLALRPDRGGIAAGPHCGLHVVDATGDPATVLRLLRELWARLMAAGLPSDHPPGEDAVQSVQVLGAVISRLRARAPFASLAWVALAVDVQHHRAELTLRGPQGEEANAWVHVQGVRPTAGYRVLSGFGTGVETPGEQASTALVTGLRALMQALRALPVLPVL